MPRTARIVIPGHIYHVTQRGNNKQQVFHNDNDYILYLKRIEEYRKKFEIDVFAYCLMDNHVHFILKPNRKESLEKMFRAVNMRYAQYFHRKMESSGHVWQGRYYSCLLLGDHIRTAIRYVECNPVRGNIVKSAWHYPWSSARAHLGKNYRWITLTDISKIISIENWKEFLTEPADEGQVTNLRKSTKRNLVLASSAQMAVLEKNLNRRIISSSQGRPVKNRVRPY